MATKQEMDNLITALSGECEKLHKVIRDIQTEVKKMDTLITRSEVLEVIDNCMKGEHK